MIELKISGAQNAKSALLFAKSVINSPLVKTAIYGADPNWGRFVMAIGKVFDFPIPLENVKICFGQGAKRVCLDAEHYEDLTLIEALRPLLQARKFSLRLNLEWEHLQREFGDVICQRAMLLKMLTILPNHY